MMEVNQVIQLGSKFTKNKKELNNGSLLLMEVNQVIQHGGKFTKNKIKLNNGSLLRITNLCQKTTGT